MVQNSLKYLPKCSQIVEELLVPLACDIIKVELRTATKAGHFPYKIVQNCIIKTNVPTIALLIIPQPVLIPSSKGLESRIQGIVS